MLLNYFTDKNTFLCECMCVFERVEKAGEREYVLYVCNKMYTSIYFFVLLYGSKMKGDTKFSPDSIMGHVYKCKPVQVIKGEIG